MTTRYERSRAGWDGLVRNLGSKKAVSAHMRSITKGRKPFPRFHPVYPEGVRVGQPAGTASSHTQKPRVNGANESSQEGN